jgi:hypothetical protein
MRPSSTLAKELAGEIHAAPEQVVSTGISGMANIDTSRNTYALAINFAVKTSRKR